MPVPYHMLETVKLAIRQTGGNLSGAAKLLGVSRQKLHYWVKQLESLRETADKAAQSPIPGDAAIIHRPAIPSPETNEVVARALEREDESIRRGLEKMGIRGEAMEMAMAIQHFQRTHFSRALEMLGGGITKQFLELMVEVEKITKQLEAGVPLVREEILRADRAAILDAMGKFYDRANKAALVQAMIAQKLRDKGEEKSRKPTSFLAINAHPGSKVDIKVPEDKPPEVDARPGNNQTD